MRTVADIARREAVLLALLVLAAVFFVYRWAVAYDLGRSSKGSPYGWYGGFDQSYYLREAHLLGHFRSIPADQFIFGPGYPALAAPFARSNDIGWPFHDPFFPANLAIWLLTVAATFLLGRRLYGAAVGAAAALVLMLATPLVRFVVVPWNTTAVLAALMLTLLVALARTIRWWHGIVLGAAIGLAYSARYIDAAWVGGVALTILVARRAAISRGRALLAGIAIGGLIVVPTLYLQWRAFGNPLSTPYAHQGVPLLSRVHITYIWSHAVQLFISPFFFSNTRAQSNLAEPLLSSMFLLVFVPVGLVQTLRRAGRARRLLVFGVAATCLAAVLFYLSYFATSGAGLQFGTGHYFKIWFPLWTLCGTWGAVVAFRWLARSLSWKSVAMRLSLRPWRLGLAGAAALLAAGIIAIVYFGSSYRLTPQGRVLSGSGESTLWFVHFQLSTYCQHPSGTQPAAGASAVSTLIALYRANPDAIVGPGVFAGQPLKAVAGSYVAELRQNNCAPEQAARLERAIGDVESVGAGVLIYGPGWSRVEFDPGHRTFRWMTATTSRLVVAGKRLERPPLELSAQVTSPVAPRTLDVLLGRKRIGTFQVAGGAVTQWITFTIPAGSGPAGLRLTAALPAGPASNATPELFAKAVMARVEQLPEPARGFVLERGGSTPAGVAAWLNNPEGKSFMAKWAASAGFEPGQIEDLANAALKWWLAKDRQSHGIAVSDLRVRALPTP